jgi:hypothetical protein
MRYLAGGAWGGRYMAITTMLLCLGLQLVGATRPGESSADDSLWPPSGKVVATIFVTAAALFIAAGGKASHPEPTWLGCADPF